MKRPSRTSIITIAVVTVVLVALAIGVLSWAKAFQDTAGSGKAQAKAGVKSLASRDASAAVSQFAAAAESFAKARALLGPPWVAGVANVIPQVGRQYAVADTLVAIGLDGSKAGAVLAGVLGEAPSVPSGGAGRLGALLAKNRANIDAALLALCDVADRSTALSENGLVRPLAEAVRSVKGALVDVAPLLVRSRALLTLERYLLSTDRRLLVVSQNSAELRPTGGFVGSYGILDIGPKGVSLEKYKDVYTLPDPRGRVSPPPGARMTRDFGFRDANWWIDFPTSARAMLGFWHGYGQPPVDGIIALDVVAVKDLLAVFGPINVPSYDETFTADNMLDRLLYLVEVRSGGLSTRKDVLVALANELEQRVLGAGAGDLARSGLALAGSADAKHVQFYLSDTAAQSAIAGMGWSGAIDPPPGSTDLLAVSNAMTLPGKINIAISKSIDYEVALRTDGSAETTLVLSYTNAAPARFPISSSLFRDYLRVYRIGDTVVAPDAPAARGSTITVDTGLPTAVREFTLSRGRSHREMIVSRVANAWPAGRAAIIPGSPAVTVGVVASSSSSRRFAHYRLFLVRQADLQDVPTTVTVMPPPGWRVSSVSAWRTASGKALAVSSTGELVRLSVPLDGDVVLDVEMDPR